VLSATDIATLRDQVGGTSFFMPTAMRDASASTNKRMGVNTGQMQ
jgi:hypothetical protein